MCLLHHVIVHSLRLLRNLCQQKISPAKRRVLKAERHRGGGGGGDSSDTGGDSTPGDTTPCDTAGDTSQSDLDVDSKDGIADSKVRDVMAGRQRYESFGACRFLCMRRTTCSKYVDLHMCAIYNCNIHVHVGEIFHIGVHINASFVTCAQKANLITPLILSILFCGAARFVTKVGICR